LEAKFQALPGGDKQEALKSMDEAIKLLQASDQPRALAKAYILRAQITDDEDKKLADFDAAVKADPENVEAWQGRAILYLAKGESEKAIADLQTLVEKDKDNPAIFAALAEALTNLKQYDEALKHADEVVKQAPRSSLGYSLRARIHVMKDNLDGAISDLDEALKIKPDDLAALLMRGRLHAAKGNESEAKADVEKALRLRPDLEQAILLRSMLAAQKKNFGEAINDMQTLLQSDPTNADYRLQMATYMVADNRPRRAIELLTHVLEGIRDENDGRRRQTKAEALRARADALLSVGQHADAVKDYDEALKLDPEDTHVLNNLAWVLATSPEDDVRNAKRSIELGLKACELTKYEKPHILSTLAAGYAEKGDFETAKKWSSQGGRARRQGRRSRASSSKKNWRATRRRSPGARSRKWKKTPSRWGLRRRVIWKRRAAARKDQGPNPKDQTNSKHQIRMKGSKAPRSF
jgi:tetratricopeptide (TPR) repeat protein